MKLKIVDRYIFREALNPFLVGVSIITVIMLSNFLFQLTDLIIIKDIPVATVLELLFYQLPEIMVQTFPMAILFATMSGLGRLNRENEFSALRMGGFSIYRLIIPLVILALIVSGVTYLLNEEVVPWTNHRARNIIRVSVLKEAMPDIQENIFFEGPEGRLFYVSRFNEQEKRLHNIVVFNREDRGRFPEVITATGGLIRDNQWRLKNGIIHSYDEEGKLKIESRFEVMDIQIARDIENFYGDQKTPSEMSREELAREIKLFKESGINVNSLRVDYHLKIALPLVPLIFVLLGTPLSLGNKESRALNIVLTVVIIFFYYFLLSLCRSLGRNQMLPPLWAAWLPNIIFTALGVILLICRESWQNLLGSILTKLFLFCLVLFLLNPAVMAEQAEEKINFSADSLSYDGSGNIIKMMGDIDGTYGHFHMFAGEVTVKQEDGGEEIYHNPRQIIMEQGGFSGCDLEKPHYYFQAQEVTIYPGDHLVARHVVFRELQGKLPLFYWPYLYISLKERDSHITPEIGYNSRRGWFLKLTYNYWFADRLPGELYLDYYRISGTAGGFKQFFVYEEEREGYVYYYTQENRTNLPGLFNWETEVSYYDDRGEWRSDTDVYYRNYDQYEKYSGDLNISKSTSRVWFNFDADFDSLDYYESIDRDDKELDLDFDYRRYFGEDWELNLDYTRDYLLNPEEGLKSRWGSSSYLARYGDNYRLKLLLERYAPQFTDEDSKEEEGVTFYRWPELSYRYNPSSAITYRTKIGHYYENQTGIRGNRLESQLEYGETWDLSDDISFSTEQIVRGRQYAVREPDPAGGSQWAYENSYRLNTDLTDNLTFINRYNFSMYRGESPFTFDDEEYVEEVKSRMIYSLGGLRINVDGGYDIYDLRYLPIHAYLSWRINPEWYLRAGSYYDPATGEYGDLALTSRYQSEHWEVNTGVRYNINNNYLEQWDNEIVYELEDEWYVGIRNSIDYENDAIEEANLVLKKNFHCRELRFSYDHLNQEFTVEYHINLFPDQGITVGTSEEKTFMFDLGIREQLGLPEGSFWNE